MSETPMKRAPVAGFDMAYIEKGAGAPVLFIHGALCDARYWAPQIEAFSRRRRAIAPSLRHCWPDEWDGGGDYTASRHVLDIIAFIEKLAAGPLHLVGHSRGGRLCLHVAARAPRLVKTLSLYQPGGAADASFLPPLPASAPQRDSPAARIAAGDVEAGVAMFLEGLMGAGYWARARGDLKAMLRANARTLVAMGRDSSEPMTRAMAEAIEAPTLLIGGTGIPPMFLRVLDALEGLLKNARRARIESASHFANLENPALFNGVLEAFFDANG